MGYHDNSHVEVLAVGDVVLVSKQLLLHRLIAWCDISELLDVLVDGGLAGPLWDVLVLKLLIGQSVLGSEGAGEVLVGTSSLCESLWGEGGLGVAVDVEVPHLLVEVIGAAVTAEDVVVKSVERHPELFVPNLNWCSILLRGYRWLSVMIVKLSCRRQAQRQQTSHGWGGMSSSKTLLEGLLYSLWYQGGVRQGNQLTQG